MTRSVTFTTAAPLDIGEPVLGADGAVTGHVIACAPACGEAFDITVAVREADEAGVAVENGGEPEETDRPV